MGNYPKREPVLSSTQNVETAPSKYTGAICNHGALLIFEIIAPASVSSAINASCPTSMPTLKNKSAVGRCICGKPVSARAPAKPIPWSNPKPPARYQGLSHNRLFCSGRDNSSASTQMDTAISHSMSASGLVTNPRDTSASVMLWPTVKAVTV